MKKKLLTTLIASVAGIATFGVMAASDPEADRQALVKYFMDMHGTTKFEGRPLKIEDFRLGAYIFDEDKYAQFKSIEEFPPYTEHVESGEKLWKTPFANGKSYTDCFGSDTKSIRTKYPYFDDAKGEVVVLGNAINACRTANGEKAYGYKDNDFNNIQAYLGFEARGQKINVKPITSPAALAAYDDGKMLFHTRRGQLNQSCSGCHIYSASRRIRSDLLSPLVGQVTHFPVLRAGHKDLTSLHDRYKGCMESVRAYAFKPYAKEFNNLEFFMTYMSNGLEIDAPGYRQ